MELERIFITRLKAASERVTAPRLAIFRIIARQAPMPLAQIILLARSDGVDRVTTYRTIDLFKSLDLVLEIGLGRNRLFELGTSFQAHHHHLRCNECGHITDFDGDEIESGIVAAARRHGFVVQSHQVEISGVCSDCTNAINTLS